MFCGGICVCPGTLGPTADHVAGRVVEQALVQGSVEYGLFMVKRRQILVCLRVQLRGMNVRAKGSAPPFWCDT